MASQLGPGELTGQKICSSCRNITLEKLCDGYLLPEYSTLQASALQCKLCGLIIFGLSDKKNHPWTETAVRPNTKLRLLARRELPFSLPTSDNRPDIQACHGRRITEIDILLESRQCGRLSVFALKGDSLALSGDILTGPVDRQANSPETFKTISSWLVECETTHQLCWRMERNELPQLPTRVLDLNLGDNLNDLRLIEPNSGRGRYVALSHCWGKTPQIKTVRENLAEFQDCIEFRCLSNTFQDAVTIARSLKVRYLWIDSLCIVQNNKSEWERESEKMGEIYRNSWITIAAAGGEDGTTGCLRQKPTPPVEPVVFKQSASNGEEGLMYIGSYQGDFISSVTKGPLNQRGWVLQERVLASRTVHFAVEQMFWECDQTTRSEDGRQFFHADSLRHTLTPNPSLHLQYMANRQTATEFLYDRWNSLIENYTSRKLTKSDDVFPALSGVVSQVIKLHADEYIAGLWRSKLHTELLWRANGKNWSPVSRPLTRRAPSWSWAESMDPFHTYPRGIFVIQKRHSLTLQFTRLESMFPVRIRLEKFGKDSSDLLAQ